MSPINWTNTTNKLDRSCRRLLYQPPLTSHVLIVCYVKKNVQVPLLRKIPTSTHMQKSDFFPNFNHLLYRSWIRILTLQHFKISAGINTNSTTRCDKLFSLNCFIQYFGLKRARTQSRKTKSYIFQNTFTWGTIWVSKYGDYFINTANPIASHLSACEMSIIIDHTAYGSSQTFALDTQNVKFN